MKLIKDKKLTFKNTFDFNFLVDLIDRNNFITTLTGNWIERYIFDNAICLQNVEKSYLFEDIFKECNSMFNPDKKRSDLDLFFSFNSGGKGIAHTDKYDVCIIGLLGKTLYKNSKEEYIVQPGDALYIKGGEEHRAIGLTPRIILSYGFGDKL
jgi:ribosomal protein L16 Arg81 hydroxylase